MVTGPVLVIVPTTRFLQGAWPAVVAAIVLWAMMRSMRRHYGATAAELAVTDPGAELARPSRVVAIVLVATAFKAEGLPPRLNRSRSRAPISKSAEPVGD
ncbi:hypothetical protein ACQEVX_30545 [Streptomyces syringium]|uniref:hypothetical protein n=1 Tax=Streptomyces syringium TaxID=76729 RepID=UPI003D8CCD01